MECKVIDYTSIMPYEATPVRKLCLLRGSSRIVIISTRAHREGNHELMYALLGVVYNASQFLNIGSLKINIFKVRFW